MQAVPRSRFVILAVLGIGGCAVDLVTKHWIFQRLGMPGEQPTWWLIDGLFGFQTSLNRGALFGMGQGHVSIFAVLSIIAAIGILGWMLFGGAARDLLLTIASGCVLGGILGNLYDRLGLWTIPGTGQSGEPAVRDWILLQYRGWVWPNFNIADSLLVVGAALLVWHAFMSGGDQRVAKLDSEPQPKG